MECILCSAFKHRPEGNGKNPPLSMQGIRSEASKEGSERACTSSEKHARLPLYWLRSRSRFWCAMSSKCTSTVLPNLQHPQMLL